MTATNTHLTIAQSLDTVAANLKQRMRGRGLTEGALASASGVSARTVSNFLRPSNRASKRGTSHSFPSGTLANLVRIASALEADAWELLCDRGEARARFVDAVELAYAERRRAEAEAEAEHHLRQQHQQQQSKPKRLRKPTR